MFNAYALVKREAGENPGRTRRCDAGVSFQYATEQSGRRNEVLIAKSEDLPVMILWSHE